MNKLEKLPRITGIASSNVDHGKTPLCDYESAQKIALKLNEAIDHITALESEVDRLKGHTHEVHEPAHDDPRVTEVSRTTPPTMETDKQ